MSNQGVAILGGGCFWCIEGIFRQLKGIIDVEPGYTGGHTSNPSYAEICTGTTGHAEVAKITYDTREFTFRNILEVFFAGHDPTTINRQGNDVGTQYRSAIFYLDEDQKQQSFDIIQELTKEKAFWDPIVTEVSKADVFYPAEQEHKDYYANHQKEPYCQIVISPKIASIRKKFAGRVK